MLWTEVKVITTIKCDIDFHSSEIYGNKWFTSKTCTSLSLYDIGYLKNTFHHPLTYQSAVDYDRHQ